jgi:iron complex outermembrane recepter protein
MTATALPFPFPPRTGIQTTECAGVRMGKIMNYPSRCAAALITVCVVMPLHAETVSNEPIVVTATRLGDDAAQIPASITVITADDIRNGTAATLPDVLRQAAGISRHSLFGNLGADDSIDLRGFGATATQNTLILLDGRRINDIDLSLVDFGSIPLDNIARIEIIHGGGAVLYGDGAVGGVINIITKQTARQGTSGQTALSTGSYATRQLSAGLNHGSGPFSLSLHAGGADSEGYRANNNLLQKNGQSALRWTGADQELYLNLGADNQQLRLPGPRTVDPGAGIDELSTDRRGTDTPDDYANQSSYYATTGVHRILSDSNEFIADIGYRNKRQRAFYANFPSYLDTELGIWSFTPRLITRYTLLGHSGQVTTGIDYYHYTYTSDRASAADTVDTPIHALQVLQRNTGVYTQLTHDLDTATSLTAGARVQWVRESADDTLDPNAPGASQYDSQAAPLSRTDREHILELGIRRRLSADTTLFAHAQRSARFATVDELFQLDSNFMQVFSPIKPQTAKQLDLGLEFKRGTVSLAPTLYYMDLTNEIHFDPNTFTNVNLDPTRRYGAELTANARINEQVRLNGSYAHRISKFRAGTFQGHDVPLVPSNTANAGIDWTIRSDLLLSASVIYNGTQRFDNDESNSFMKIPAYQTVQTKLTHTEHGWHISGAIDNLFNKEAFDYGVRSTFTPGRYNAYPLAGRTYNLSVEVDL